MTAPYIECLCLVRTSKFIILNLYFSKFDYQNNPSSTLQVRIIRRARAVTLRDIYTGVAKQVFNIISI